MPYSIILRIIGSKNNYSRIIGSHFGPKRIIGTFWGHMNDESHPFPDY